MSEIINNIEDVERHMLSFPQVECPVRNFFSPGVYLREMTMPAGTFAIGQHHNFAHINIMVKGVIKKFNDDGTSTIMTAPQTFVGSPGKKAWYVIEEVVWQNVYATNGVQDIEQLESYLLTKSEETVRLENLVLDTPSEKGDVLPVLPVSLLPYGCYKFQINNERVFATGHYEKDELIGPVTLNNHNTSLFNVGHSTTNANAILVPVDGNIYLYATQPIIGKTGSILGEEILVDYRFAKLTFQENTQCAPGL